ncbi:hypothetical protein HXX76_015856 [Chlamydomonas incerta]|uniref:WW domain-containing protein n=1 Tax=Chlamydomonas incerta TaxID=51695 RepID=A0A835S8G4_CHLIN|nr:hypothetical protein HXX76_015856 [Chlamydomonas incerta]|eukprot:KAG2422692.1 hypothetical protein HXX76_015856 [Chlamydomonas incerta]
MLRKVAFVALVALCLSASCLAQKSEFKHLYKKVKDVPGVAKGEDGQFYINVEEEKYYVVKDQESKNIYFVNEATSEPQWHDPRGPAPKVGENNVDITIPLEPPSLKAKGSTFTIAFVAMLPVLLFAGGTFGRIMYLQIHYPEMLWPTKERRDRRRAAGGKAKPQKQRGKMNQDGKGGRSANS